MASGLTGWSCIFCGCALSGPQEGQEHQESGECPFSVDTEVDTEVDSEVKEQPIPQKRRPRAVIRKRDANLGDRRGRQ